MSAPASPTVRRRRLAAELREIREDKGKSGDAVAAALRWSPSKISRYERARTGLLQTEDYARHIIGSYSRVEPMPPGMIGRMVKVRMRRQQVLNREELELSVVLDESVLKRRIGDEPVMYEQLQRLVKEADRPNLTLQILPLNAQHTVFGESFVVFGFRDDSDAMLHDVVITEQLRSSVTLEGERETYLHRIAFRSLSEAALDPAASRELLLDTAESYWSGAWRRASA